MQASGNRFSSNPLLTLIFGAVCVSFAPVFVKLIGDVRLGPTAIGFWRTLFGGVALLTFAIVCGRSVLISRRLLGFSLLAGFIFFLDLFFWHRSIIFSGAGMATVLANMQVFIIATLGFFLLKERLSVHFFASALAAVVGLVALVGLFSEEVIFSSRYISGIGFGLATALVYAHYLITLKWCGQKVGIPDVVVFMGWTSLFSALFLGVALLIEQERFFPPDAETLGLLVALGVVVQATAWWAITRSLSRINASRAGLVLLLQPTLAVIWGVVLLSEKLTLLQTIGAAVTLTAMYFGGMRGNNSDRKDSR